MQSVEVFCGWSVLDAWGSPSAKIPVDTLCNLTLESQGSSTTVTRSRRCWRLLSSKSGCCSETPVELFERNTRVLVPCQSSGSWERMIGWLGGWVAGRKEETQEWAGVGWVIDTLDP